MTASSLKDLNYTQWRNRRSLNPINNRGNKKEVPGFGPLAPLATTRPRTIRGSSMLVAVHGMNADRKNELLLLRSLAFDAHSCIMVRVLRDPPYIRMWPMFFAIIANLKRARPRVVIGFHVKYSAAAA